MPSPTRRIFRFLLLVVLILLGACGPTDESVFPDAFSRADAGPQADARVIVPIFDAPRIDARLLPDAPPHPDAPPQPHAGQPANVGWIGGTCAGVADCHFTGAICLGADFPEGLCTEECTDTCPDRHQPRDTVTACVDASPFGFDQGLCVSRCDQTVWPGPPHGSGRSRRAGAGRRRVGGLDDPL